MKTKPIFFAFLLTSILSISSCVSYRGPDSVSVFPQPEPNRIMVTVDGGEFDSPDQLLLAAKGRVAHEALDRLMTGFYIYDQDTKPLVTTEMVANEEGKMVQVVKTRSSIKLYALLVNEQVSNMGEYFDAAAVAKQADESHKQDANGALAGGVVGFIALVIFVIIGLNQKQ